MMLCLQPQSRPSFDICEVFDVDPCRGMQVPNVSVDDGESLVSCRDVSGRLRRCRMRSFRSYRRTGEVADYSRRGGEVFRYTGRAVVTGCEILAWLRNPIRCTGRRSLSATARDAGGGYRDDHTSSSVGSIQRPLELKEDTNQRRQTFGVAARRRTVMPANNYAAFALGYNSSPVRAQLPPAVYPEGNQLTAPRAIVNSPTCA